MTAYTENSSQRSVTAGQAPATPTAIEWLAIMGARGANIWAEPGHWVIRYDDTGEITSCDASYFAAHFTAVG